VYQDQNGHLRVDYRGIEQWHLKKQ
jgi:hypothetical protein